LEAAIAAATKDQAVGIAVSRLREAGFSCALTQSPPVCFFYDRVSGGEERLVRATWNAHAEKPHIAVEYMLTWF